MKLCGQHLRENLDPPWQVHPHLDWWYRPQLTMQATVADEGIWQATEGSSIKSLQKLPVPISTCVQRREKFNTGWPMLAGNKPHMCSLRNFLCEVWFQDAFCHTSRHSSTHLGGNTLGGMTLIHSTAESGERMSRDDSPILVEEKRWALPLVCKKSHNGMLLGQTRLAIHYHTLAPPAQATTQGPLIHNLDVSDWTYSSWQPVYFKFTLKPTFHTTSKLHVIVWLQNMYVVGAMENASAWERDTQDSRWNLSKLLDPPLMWKRHMISLCKQ